MKKINSIYWLKISIFVMVLQAVTMLVQGISALAITSEMRSRGLNIEEWLANIHSMSKEAIFATKMSFITSLPAVLFLGSIVAIVFSAKVLAIQKTNSGQNADSKEITLFPFLVTLILACVVGVLFQRWFVTDVWEYAGGFNELYEIVANI